MVLLGVWIATLKIRLQLLKEKKPAVMSKMKYLLMSFLMLMFFLITKAQEKVEMADTMRSNGRIYVVVQW
jgi:hypothetical protein